MTKDGLYTAGEVCKLTSMTYRELYYWMQRGPGAPTGYRAKGKGSHSLWTWGDVERLLKLMQVKDRYETDMEIIMAESPKGVDSYQAARKRRP